MPKNAKTGRPKKDEADYLLRIVDAYVCANGTSVLAQRGLYKRLEEYAQSVFRTNLKSYDFSRSTEVKELVEQYIQEEDEKKCVLGLVYEPLDINGLIQKGAPDIKKSLIEREKYIEKLYHAAANAIVAHDTLAGEKVALKKQCENLQTENAGLAQQYAQMKDDLNRLKQENARFKRIIKQEVEPEQARKMLEVRDAEKDSICCVTIPIDSYVRKHESISEMFFGEDE